MKNHRQNNKYGAKIPTSSAYSAVYGANKYCVPTSIGEEYFVRRKHSNKNRKLPDFIAA